MTRDRAGLPRLGDAELLQLRRWNTPTIYNGWEQITRQDAGKDGFNVEDICDFMPQMGPMCGYAVTAVFEPSNAEHARRNPGAWSEYRQYVGGEPGPKIVVVQDLDKPRVIGAIWGEVTSSFHRAVGCVGTITDGGVRDLDEMNAVGFKVLARRLCVGHAYAAPLRWGCEVEVFGRKVQPGQLIHADKHGFLAVPAEDEARLLEAAMFMDNNELCTMIGAARSSPGMSAAAIVAEFDAAAARFHENARERFGPRSR